MCFVCVKKPLDIYPRDRMVPIKLAIIFFLLILENFSSQLLHYHIFSFNLGEGTSLLTFYASLKIHLISSGGRKHLYSVPSFSIGCALGHDCKNVVL